MEEKTNYLAHHGVKGQKWGVRRYQNADGSLTSAGRKRLGYPMTKKQVKKAIRTAKRAERKRTGEWMTTGKNMTRVDKAFSKAKREDQTLKEIDTRRGLAGKQMDKAQSIINEKKKDIDKARIMKETLIKAQNDPSFSRDARRELERHYIADKETAKVSQEVITKQKELLAKAKNKYDAEDTAYYKRTQQIGKQYVRSYKEAAVKDLGIQDIELGIKMLEDYGLVNKATRMKWKGID